MFSCALDVDVNRDVDDDDVGVDIGVGVGVGVGAGGIDVEARAHIDSAGDVAVGSGFGADDRAAVKAAACCQVRVETWFSQGSSVRSTLPLSAQLSPAPQPRVLFLHFLASSFSPQPLGLQSSIRPPLTFSPATQ
mmetsp:Transcript_11759/g.20953  ORF Transcript_11759/g.20953 Transcript_11759/m.20953 type:complete len:135 (-) Transcript_11759:97-501(-)